METREFNRQLGLGLRALRMQRGLSLARFEEVFPGKLRKSTLLSYELGARSIPIEKLVELAAFYHVPATVLIP